MLFAWMQMASKLLVQINYGTGLPLFFGWVQQLQGSRPGTRTP
jgi:hypothetical protein